MKKLILCVCVFALTTSLSAQKKTKEIAINLGASNNYALSYRVGTTKSLWRFNLLSSSISVYNAEHEYSNFTDEVIEIDNYENDSHSIGFSIGKEFRKPIANKLEFRYGFDAGLNYVNFSSENIDSTYNPYTESYTEGKTLTPSVNGIIGFNYVINKNIVVGIEVLPRFSYAITNHENNRYYEDGEITKTETDSDIFRFNLNSESTRLSLAYRF